MDTKRNDIAVKIHGGLCVGLALSLLLIPLKWVIAWCIASLLHEFAHYVMLRICRVAVLVVELRPGGAVMRTGSMYPWQEILCALAGPFAGLLLLLAAGWFPRLALCGLFQSLYNLLPIFPLDGGRVLHGILIQLFGQIRGERIAGYTEKVMCAVLVCIAAYAAMFLNLGLLPLISVFSVIIKKKRKLSCKPRALRVK